MQQKPLIGIVPIAAIFGVRCLAFAIGIVADLLTSMLLCTSRCVVAAVVVYHSRAVRYLIGSCTTVVLEWLCATTLVSD